jgi:polysaccharide deacetylase 2 family uncharacterized protein YibQ
VKFPLKLKFGKGKSDADEDDDEDIDDFDSEGPDDDPEADDGDAATPDESDDADADDGADDGADDDDDDGADDDDDDDDADFDDEDDEDDGSAGGKRRLIIIGGAAAAVVLVLAGGGAWWALSGPDAPTETARKVDQGGIPLVSMRLAPKGAAKTDKSALTPPAAAAGRSLNAIGAVGNSVSDTAAEPVRIDDAEEEAPPPADSDGAAPKSLNALGAEAGVAPTAASAGGAQAAGRGLMVAAVTAASFSAVPMAAPATPLSATPDPALVEDTPNGSLPKVGEDGRTVLAAYARPFDAADKRPRIAVIVAGLGLSRAATEAAVRRLPGAVTLAFDHPYADGLEGWTAMARQAGHEVLLTLPLEPNEFPLRDPGPYALLTALEPADNLRRLDFVLGRLGGYVGVLFGLGSRFKADDKQIRPLLKALKGRGLMVVDIKGGTGSLAPGIAADLGVPRAASDLVLDRVPSKAFIDTQLAALEAAARRSARAVAVGAPYPSTIERLAAWVPTLAGKKLVLAPISALADKTVSAKAAAAAKAAAKKTAAEKAAPGGAAAKGDSGPRPGPPKPAAK